MNFEDIKNDIITMFKRLDKSNKGVLDLNQTKDLFYLLGLASLEQFFPEFFGEHPQKDNFSLEEIISIIKIKTTPKYSYEEILNALKILYE